MLSASAQGRSSRTVDVRLPPRTKVRLLARVWLSHMGMRHLLSKDAVVDQIMHTIKVSNDIVQWTRLSGRPVISRTPAAVGVRWSARFKSAAGVAGRSLLTQSNATVFPGHVNSPWLTNPWHPPERCPKVLRSLFLTPWRGRGSLAVRAAIGFRSAGGHRRADRATDGTPLDTASSYSRHHAWSRQGQSPLD
jgi:hypothetical protein